MKDLLSEARDITTPKDGVDNRTSLTDLLRRLGTAADISISAIAQMIGISSPNQVSSEEMVGEDETLDFEQYKIRLFQTSKTEIDNLVNELKFDLQEAKV